MALYGTQVEDRSISELLSEMGGELGELVRKEVELAKLETKSQVSRAAKGGVLLGATGIGGLIGLILLAMSAAWGLAEVLPAGVAFLVIGLVFVAAAGAFLAAGRRRLADLRPTPEQTRATIRQDVQTAKASFARGVQERPNANGMSRWA